MSLTSGDDRAGTGGRESGSSVLQTAVIANLVGCGWPTALGFAVSVTTQIRGMLLPNLGLSRPNTGWPSVRSCA